MDVVDETTSGEAGATMGDGAETGSTSGASGDGDGGDGDGDGGDGDGVAETCPDAIVPPVLHYSFDACAPTVVDEMGTAPDLELQAGTCGSNDALSGALGGAWSSGTAVECPGVPAQCASAVDDPIFEPERFTISAWVYADDWQRCGTAGYPETCTIVSKGNTDGDSNGYWFSAQPSASGTELRLTLAAGGGETEVTAEGGALIPSTWHHVVATFDGWNVALFVDGALVSSTTSAFGVTYAAERFYVGTLSFREEFSLVGRVDEVKLWDCAKDTAGVAALYDEYAGG
jgi:hypothetical protein